MNFDKFRGIYFHELGVNSQKFLPLRYVQLQIEVFLKRNVNLSHNYHLDIPVISYIVIPFSNLNEKISEAIKQLVKKFRNLELEKQGQNLPHFVKKLRRIVIMN